MNIGVIFIQPMLLSSRQEILINQFAAIRDHRNVLKAKVWLIAKFMFRFHLLYHDDILDADAKGSILVVSWLVGDDVSGCERNLGILYSGSYAYGSFVDV
jgi:hypothetical protein